MINSFLVAMGTRLIDRFIPDETEATKAKVDLIQAEQNGELAHLDAQMQIMLAEAKSSDPWTSRARPSFMYVFYLILITNCMIIPIIGIWQPQAMTTYYANLKLGLDAIPTELWTLFGVAFTGYTASRSYDKAQIISKKKTLLEQVFNR